MPSGVHHRRVSGLHRRRARSMRHEATEAEAVVWRLLRDRRLAKLKFRRQVPFQNYILDFVCFEQRVIVEIDGGQHAVSKTDSVRDAVLTREGFRVLRYWNSDVLRQPEAVLQDLLVKLGCDSS